MPTDPQSHAGASVRAVGAVLDSPWWRVEAGAAAAPGAAALAAFWALPADAPCARAWGRGGAPCCAALDCMAHAASQLPAAERSATFYLAPFGGSADAPRPSKAWSARCLTTSVTGV